MTNLKFNPIILENMEKTKVLYDDNYLDDESIIIFNYISKIFDNESINYVANNGGLYKLNRKTLVFIDKNIDKTIIPKIWGQNIKILEFPEYLLKLKNRLENDLNFKFNICLANYYDNGKNTIGFHSDNEEKGSISCIASISLGATRKLVFRNKDTKEICNEIILSNNSLLVMTEGTQENYEHSLVVDKECKIPRLNLTFRLFDNDRYSLY